MLYIAIVICVIILIALLVNDYDFDYAPTWFTSIGAFALVVGLFITLGEYNTTKSTVDKKIAVLQEQNETVLAQIEPLVDKYLGYESGTYKDLKMDVNNMVALSQYPQLKGDEFIRNQVAIVTKNQKAITELKLEKAGLNAYKMWIFMGE